MQASTLSLTDHIATVNHHSYRNVTYVSKGSDIDKVAFVFAGEPFASVRPSLDEYQQLYEEANYPPEIVQSLIEGLAKSSLYESKTS